MFKNYLKIALRNFKRHKGYTFLNIAGFAIGMACCLIFFLYVRHETGFDTYHKDVERIYRIAQDIRTSTSNRFFAPVSPMVGPTLKADYPQIEQTARLLTRGSRLVRRAEIVFYEDRFMYADNELFEIFTIPFIQGSPQNALSRPQTLVISETMAQKYFSGENPLGKTLEINSKEYEITGVAIDSPKNTHLKYDLIASLETLNDWSEMSNWYSTMFFTYLKVKPNVNMEEFSQQISHVADKYVGERLATSGTTYFYFLQHVPSIHLYSNIGYDVEPSGNPLYVKIFSLVGLFILLIAGLNFMNLATARAANRSKEVGLRKVVGAQRLQLIGQFLGESILMAILSLGLALVLARFMISLLNNLIGLTLNFADLLRPDILVVLLGGACLVGVLAGLYPAFVLSSFKPAITLKGVLSGGSRNIGLRTVLVVVQFTISVFLIIGTLSMYKQYDYMRSQNLGFEKEQKLILPLRGGIDVEKSFETVKDIFSNHSSVSGVTVSSSIPGRKFSSFSIRLVGEEDAKNQDMFHLHFDTDFVPNYGIEMVEGRSFMKEMKTDFMGAFLINEAAVKAFGWTSPEDALGKRLQTGYGGRINPIIGVTKNFHFRGLQTEVEPLVMEFLPWSFNYLTLSMDITHIKETMTFVESQWKILFPENPFESFFLDMDFNRQYKADEQAGSIFSIFTLLGLVIACLGLFGLASFMAESRTREIGIRKVLGASTSGLVVMLSKQFIKWVILANGVAWPIAYIFIDRWLKNFAYRSNIGIGIFIFSGVVTLFIALLTISFQSIKAAASSPVEALKYE
ncbi:MAG: ABC transporter permease [Candidatus Aminicenantes bacterium]|nr:ABC transporter permease [Candidatus Aminicenantes bacterium]